MALSDISYSSVDYTTGTKSFVVPAGYTKLNYFLIGAGGGGASFDNSINGGGGGAGAYAYGSIDVSADDIIDIAHDPIGGVGGVTPSLEPYGTAGGPTTITNTTKGVTRSAGGGGGGSTGFTGIDGNGDIITNFGTGGAGGTFNADSGENGTVGGKYDTDFNNNGGDGGGSGGGGGGNTGSGGTGKNGGVNGSASSNDNGGNGGPGSWRIVLTNPSVPPSVPTNVTFSITKNASVELSWSNPEFIGDVSAWYDISGSFGLSRTVYSLSTTFTSLTLGSAYTFQVSARTNFGVSPPVTVIIPYLGVIPSAPTDLSASLIAGRTVRLTWNPPIFLGDVSAWYDISGSYGLSRTVYDLSATFTGLTDGSAYTFEVRARNNIGTSPPVSVSITIPLPNGPPSVPTDVKISIPKDTNIQLTWSNPEFIGDVSAWYDISGSFGLTRTVYSLSTTFTGLTNGLAYTFQVSARTNFGVSPPVTVTIPYLGVIPSAPTDLSASNIAEKTVRLTWNPPVIIGDVSAWYDISGSYGLSRTVYDLSATFTGLTDGSAYTFEVRSRNKIGTSPPVSVSITVPPPTGPPSVPTDVTFSIIKDASVLLTWGNPEFIGDVSAWYDISGSFGLTRTVYSLSTVFTSLTLGTAYIFQVSARTNFGVSPPVTVTIPYLGVIPSEPTDLSASNIAEKTVRLTWNPPVIIGDVSAWYDISGSYGLSRTVYDLSATFTGLTDGSAYTFQVTARNTRGSSPPVSVTIPYVGIPPSVPRDVSGTILPNQTFQLTWTPPATIGDISAWYDISGSYGLSRTVYGTTATFTGLMYGIDYSFQIKARNNLGISPPVTVTVNIRILPTVPRDLSGTILASQTVRLLWTAPATLGDISAWYDISGSYGFSRTVYATTATLTGLTDGSAYTFQVTARNTLGSSSPVSISFPYVGVPPSVPLDLSGSVIADKTVRLTWTPPATLGDISAWYDISGSYGLSRTVYGTTATFTGLTNGAAYTFQVRARNNLGVSSLVSVTIPYVGVPPSSPRDLSATVIPTNDLLLSWSPPVTIGDVSAWYIVSGTYGPTITVYGLAATFTGLTDGNYYTFQIQARNKLGASMPVSITLQYFYNPIYISPDSIMIGNSIITSTESDGIVMINGNGCRISQNSLQGLLQGVYGYTGPTGSTGASGVSGAVGRTGISGVIGFTGATGPAGATGTTGASGTIGGLGQTGMSGFTGAVGSSGPPGHTGMTGAVGPAGVMGPNGNTGVNGFTGATGETGVSGIPGPIGQIGLTGMTGATGATGASSGVMQIIAGTNITISPLSGIGPVTINATAPIPGTYMLKITAGSNSGTLTTGMTVVGFQDPTGAVLLNSWPVTAPTVSAYSGGAAGTYFQIQYPSTFTGTFLNFRRYVYQAGPPVYYLSSNISVSATSGNCVLLAPSTNTIQVCGITTPFTAIAPSTTFYFAFDYSTTALF